MSNIVDDNHSAFLLEEFKALRQEIDARIKESRLIEVGTVTAIAAIFAWLATRGDNPIVALGWWIPLPLSLFGSFRYFSLIHRMLEIAEYIRSIEKSLCPKSPHGWETFLKEKRQSITGRLISTSSYCLWVFLIVVSLILAIKFGS